MNKVIFRFLSLFLYSSFIHFFVMYLTILGLCASLVIFCAFKFRVSKLIE